MNTTTRKSFIPAAGNNWALPFYDPFVKLTGGDRARRVLLENMDTNAIHRMLDIGCGTGTLTLEFKLQHPHVEVVGLDPDIKALEIARLKASSFSAIINFDDGFSHELPYLDSSFDLVFSTLMLHHLTTEQKQKTLCEVRRVLNTNGSLYLLDFELKHNSQIQIIHMAKQAGFTRVRILRNGSLFFGLLPLRYYRIEL